MAKDNREVYLRKARLSYPHFINKHRSSPDSRPKYSASFLLDPNDEYCAAGIEDVNRALDAACMKAFKETYEDMYFKDGRNCFIRGETVVDERGKVKRGYDGMMVVNSSNDNRPGLLFRDKTPLSIIEQEDGKSFCGNNPFYGGCWVQAIVRFYGTRKGGSPGLFSTVELVRFAKDGESFGGSAPVNHDILDDEIDFCSQQ